MKTTAALDPEPSNGVIIGFLFMKSGEIEKSTTECTDYIKEGVLFSLDGKDCDVEVHRAVEGSKFP